MSEQRDWLSACPVCGAPWSTMERDREPVTDQFGRTITMRPLVTWLDCASGHRFELLAHRRAGDGVECQIGERVQ